MKFYGRRTCWILALVAVFCANPRTLAAQSGVGAAALSGVVTDATKGALPEVSPLR